MRGKDFEKYIDEIKRHSGENLRIDQKLFLSPPSVLLLARLLPLLHHSIFCNAKNISNTKILVLHGGGG
ncbi:MAG: hypothetical protein J7L58_03980 [Thermoplasmata archaeon]|nr:hypothetical protein [Thermoplasmata archaeon]